MVWFGVVWFGRVTSKRYAPPFLSPSSPPPYNPNPKTQTVYTEKCRSWYKLNNQEQGPVVGLWPGSCLHALRALAHPRWEDFEYVYLGPELEGEGEREGEGRDSEGGGEGGRERGNKGVEREEGKKEKEGSRNRLYWLGNGMTWCEEKMEGDRKCILLFCLSFSFSLPCFLCYCLFVRSFIYIILTQLSRLS